MSSVKSMIYSGISVKSSFEILNQKAQEEKTSQENKAIIEKAKISKRLKDQGIDLEQQEHEKVINDMVNEEQPKIQIPVEDMENLIRVVETQRNSALTRVAVEQSRNKTLLATIEKQKQTIESQARTIKTLTETVKNTENSQ